MGITRDTIKAGDGVNFPKQGDQLTMHYTGTLVDGGKIRQFGRQGQTIQFVIGIGQVVGMKG